MSYFVATIVIVVPPSIAPEIERATRVVEFAADNADMARDIAAKKADETATFFPGVETFVESVREVE
jgi:hypothetical protein